MLTPIFKIATGELSRLMGPHFKHIRDAKISIQPCLRTGLDGCLRAHVPILVVIMVLRRLPLHFSSY